MLTPQPHSLLPLSNGVMSIKVIRIGLAKPSSHLFLRPGLFFCLLPPLVPSVLTLPVQIPATTLCACPSQRLTLCLIFLQKMLFAGSHSQLVQLPLADCTKYHLCADCVLARDPYCAWNVNTSRCVATFGDHSG